MRVSIVAAPWRRLIHAARWNGQAPQTATGAASVRESHCQLVNCRAGIIAIAMTGRLSTAEMSRRRRRDSRWASLGATGWFSAALLDAAGGAGIVAP